VCDESGKANVKLELPPGWSLGWVDVKGWIMLERKKNGDAYFATFEDRIKDETWVWEGCWWVRELGLYAPCVTCACAADIGVLETVSTTIRLAEEM
jgi:hypothetical protein